MQTVEVGNFVVIVVLVSSQNTHNRKKDCHSLECHVYGLLVTFITINGPVSNDRCIRKSHNKQSNEPSSSEIASSAQKAYASKDLHKNDSSDLCTFFPEQCMISSF